MTTAKKIFSKVVVNNCLIKSHSRDKTLKEELKTERPSNLDNDILNAILKQNPHHLANAIADKLKTLESTICHHLKKLLEFLQVSNERNKEIRMSIIISLYL